MFCCEPHPAGEVCHHDKVWRSEPGRMMKVATWCHMLCENSNYKLQNLQSQGFLKVLSACRFSLESGTCVNLVCFQLAVSWWFALLGMPRTAHPRDLKPPGDHELIWTDERQLLFFAFFSAFPHFFPSKGGEIVQASFRSPIQYSP